MCSSVQGGDLAPVLGEGRWPSKGFWGIIEMAADQLRQYQLNDVQNRYRILALLGSGGMADIFLGAQHGAENFSRLVVIKRVRDGSCDRAEGVRMFLDEARIVASLNHPHIVKIYDLARMENDVCIVMEYINGENLFYLRSACKKRGLRMPLGVICKLIMEAAETLHYAHTATGSDGKPLNLIHRDISTSNFLISATGYLKVIDFGIAKSSTQTELSSPGLLKGRVPYLGPEVFEEDTIDGRLDLYALGLVLYELVALEYARKYAQDVPIANVIKRVTTENLPSLARQFPDIDPRIDDIVAKATHKDREQRYQQGAELASDIHSYAERCGGIATTGQVEKWFHENFAKRIAKRRAFEREAFEKLEQSRKHSCPTGPAQGQRDLAADSESPALISGSSNRMTKDAASAGLSGSESPATSEPHPKRWRLGFAAIAVCAAGAGLFLRGLPLEQAPAPEAAPQADNTQAGNLFVTSVPEGATVIVGSQVMGQTGADGLTTSLTPGLAHEVILKLDGYDDYRVVVEGTSTGQQRVTANLTKLTKERPQPPSTTPAKPRRWKPHKRTAPRPLQKATPPPKEDTVAMEETEPSLMSPPQEKREETLAPVENAPKITMMAPPPAAPPPSPAIQPAPDGLASPLPQQVTDERLNKTLQRNYAVSPEGVIKGIFLSKVLKYSRTRASKIVIPYELNFGQTRRAALETLRALNFDARKVPMSQLSANIDNKTVVFLLGDADVVKASGMVSRAGALSVSDAAKWSRRRLTSLALIWENDKLKVLLNSGRLADEGHAFAPELHRLAEDVAR